MSYDEDDLLPISALQHLLFCERQCALIHIERIWVENRFTAEGQVLHRKAHDAPPKTRDGTRITRGLLLRLLELGLAGQADVVTWKPPPRCASGITPLPVLLAQQTTGLLHDWEVTPIEYKRGRPQAQRLRPRANLCTSDVP
jgi:CRISPR-associated exonuclease Cas4